MLNFILKPVEKFLPENNRFEKIWKLAQVDFQRRYYNDKFGLLWALINPICQALIYTIAFQIIRGTNEANFGLNIFAALIFWNYFSETLLSGVNLLATKKALILSINISKFDLYISSSLASLFGLIFNIAAYILIALFFDISFSYRAFLIIPVIAELFLITTGFSMILGYLNIFFKDIKHLVRIALLFGFWTSGIFFSVEAIINYWEPLYFLNPLIGMLENIRNAIFHDSLLSLPIFASNLVYSILTVFLGYILIKYFSFQLIENL